MARAVRYFSAMSWLAAAILTAATAQNAAPQLNLDSVGRVVVQAQATVRIISGAHIRLDGQPSPEAPPATDSVVHTEGLLQPARLVEFQ
ncbi:MAG TPA: hypothetical protein VM145_00610 [Sphingomicrobium sp.]|nr:hypothetical protein [Sphingomicrobium sp.]